MIVDTSGLAEKVSHSKAIFLPGTLCMRAPECLRAKLELLRTLRCRRRAKGQRAFLIAEPLGIHQNEVEDGKSENAVYKEAQTRPQASLLLLFARSLSQDESSTGRFQNRTVNAHRTFL